VKAEKFSLNFVSGDGVVHGCDLDLHFGSRIALELHSDLFPAIREEAEDAFEALCRIRVRLERDGCMILCNGARKDAYPSRLSRQMGAGLSVYAFKDGQPARIEDRLDTFGPAGADQVGSVAEQRTMFERWIRSL